MNRTLKRPMFRMGGAAEGITSGLDQPRKQYNEGSNPFSSAREMGMATARSAIPQLLPTDSLKEPDATTKTTLEQLQEAADFKPLTGRQELARFLIPFGLDFATRTPAGGGMSGLFSTAAGAAKAPAEMLFQRRDKDEDFQRKLRLQAAGIDIDKLSKEEERKFQENLLDKELKAKAAETDKLIQSRENIAAMKAEDDGVYQVLLEKYVENDLPPQVAKRAALFSTQQADNLRSAVGGTRYGGVLEFDVRDPNNQKTIRKLFNGKVVYDPYEDNYKYIVIRDGEVFFDEFNSIADIKFPDPKTTEQKEIIDRAEKSRKAKEFGLDMDDPN